MHSRMTALRNSAYLHSSRDCVRPTAAAPLTRTTAAVPPSGSSTAGQQLPLAICHWQKWDGGIGAGWPRAQQRVLHCTGGSSAARSSSSSGKSSTSRRSCVHVLNHALTVGSMPAAAEAVTHCTICLLYGHSAKLIVHTAGVIGDPAACRCLIGHAQEHSSGPRFSKQREATSNIQQSMPGSTCQYDSHAARQSTHTLESTAGGREGADPGASDTWTALYTILNGGCRRRVRSNRNHLAVM